MYKARFAEPANGTLHRILVFFERQSCRWANHIITANDSYKRLQVVLDEKSPTYAPPTFTRVQPAELAAVGDE